MCKFSDKSCSKVLRLTGCQFATKLNVKSVCHHVRCLTYMQCRLPREARNRKQPTGLTFRKHIYPLDRRCAYMFITKRSSNLVASVSSFIAVRDIGEALYMRHSLQLIGSSVIACLIKVYCIYSGLAPWAVVSQCICWRPEIHIGRSMCHIISIRNSESIWTP